MQSTVTIPTKQCDRENVSGEADIDKSSIIGSGTFKNVYGGLYSEGPRQDEFCVAKEMKQGPVELENLFWDELHACTTAANLIEKFNKLEVVDKPIKLNRPEVWEYTANNKLMLIEPYIEAFQKFNSNTGWAAANSDGDPWVKIVQALSHFSYHASGGACVLCDLQGAVYDEFLVLTDPVIMSRTAEFGATDMGADGIKTFFVRHKCNEFCDPKWSTPRDQKAYYPEREGTSACTVDGKVIDPSVMKGTPQLESIPEKRPINRGTPGRGERGIYGGPKRPPNFGKRSKHPLATSSPGVRLKSPSPSIKSEKGSQKMFVTPAGSRQASVSLENAAKEKKALTVLRNNLATSSKANTWKAVRKHQ